VCAISLRHLIKSHPSGFHLRTTRVEFPYRNHFELVLLSRNPWFFSQVSQSLGQA
jgi:hypothetical protein